MSVDCPVCEKGPFESVDPHLKGHVTGTPDPDHVWSEVKDQLEDPPDDPPESTDGDDSDDPPSEGAPEGDPDGGSNGGSADPDDTGEADPTTQPPETSDDDQTDDSDDTPSSPTMSGSTDDDDQWTSGSTDPDDDRDQTPQPPQTPVQDDSGGIPIPVSTTTLVMVVGLIAVGALLWVYVRGSSDSTPDVETGTDAEVDDVQDDVENNPDEKVGGAGLVTIQEGADE